METIKKMPNDYPNIYFYCKFNYKIPSVTFIRFAVTPTGRRGKDFEQFRVYFIPDRGNALKSNEEIIKMADQQTSPNRLKKGYKWGEMFVQHDFSERNFTNK
jgi:hypothetical protein